MSDERLTTDAAIKYLESIIYEDFAPYTQKCLSKVIEAARKEESMTTDWEKRIERIVEKLEEAGFKFVTHGGNRMVSLEEAIEIVKGGGVDEVD